MRLVHSQFQHGNSTVVHFVLSLYINCHVCSKKLVLSYLLSQLLLVLKLINDCNFGKKERCRSLALLLTAHLLLLISQQSYELAPPKRQHYSNLRRF
jgi:hypothetical protein